MTYQVDPVLKALGFNCLNCLKVKALSKVLAFNCQPVAPLQRGGGGGGGGGAAAAAALFSGGMFGGSGGGGAAGRGKTSVFTLGMAPRRRIVPSHCPSEGACIDTQEHTRRV